MRGTVVVGQPVTSSPALRRSAGTGTGKFGSQTAALFSLRVAEDVSRLPVPVALLACGASTVAPSAKEIAGRRTARWIAAHGGWSMGTALRFVMDWQRGI